MAVPDTRAKSGEAKINIIIVNHSVSKVNIKDPVLHDNV